MTFRNIVKNKEDLRTAILTFGYCFHMYIHPNENNDFAQTCPLHCEECKDGCEFLYSVADVIELDEIEVLNYCAWAYLDKRDDVAEVEQRILTLAQFIGDKEVYDDMYESARKELLVHPMEA